MIGLTQKQIWAFFRAATAGAAALGLDKETYRYQVMREEVGKESIKHLDRKRDFEDCMIRFWSDAGDFEMAARYMCGDARRLGRMCEVCAAQIAQITGSPAPKSSLPYILGILQQAGYAPRISGPRWSLDLPEADTRRVFSILDTHRRRLLRAARCRFPYTFHIDASYKLTDSGTIIFNPHSDKSHPKK